ncbi:MAG TPA: hypothetical protein VHU91_01340 [Mycobacteriales bacterium]|jgi:hypothetical protein|nr:hypothetical protein [Mycobacteriales bacterium]
MRSPSGFSGGFVNSKKLAYPEISPFAVRPVTLDNFGAGQWIAAGLFRVALVRPAS